MPYMVVVCNIFEESGVIFTNTCIILAFLVLCIFIYCQHLFLPMSSTVIRLYLLKFFNNLNIEF